MKYTNPIQFKSSIIDNPKTKRLGTKLFWSLFCPVLMIIIAMIMSKAAGTDLFFVGGFASASVIWFLSISTIISLFSARFTNKTLRIINLVCGKAKKITPLMYILAILFVLKYIFL